MLPSFADDVVQVIEPSWFDDRGTATADYNTPASVTPVPGCSVQYGASSEDLAGRTNLTVRYTVLAPPGAPITEHSAVEFEGVRYSVEGMPARWKSPTGAVSHVSVLLVDWRG